jgi:hypothetical protein
MRGVCAGDVFCRRNGIDMLDVYCRILLPREHEQAELYDTFHFVRRFYCGG